MAKPNQERAICPACGRKMLGNTYVASYGVLAPFAYRQCARCDYRLVLGPAKPVATKPDFPLNAIERNVFALFSSGKGGGQLAAYYVAGLEGQSPPPRSESAAYAAWRAGNDPR